MDAMRLDKWLWAARSYKTRSLAQTACDGGKVDVNGQAAKPARAIRPGDRIQLTQGEWRREAVVKVLSSGAGRRWRPVCSTMTFLRRRLLGLSARRRPSPAPGARAADQARAAAPRSDPWRLTARRGAAADGCGRAFALVPWNTGDRRS